MIKDKYRFKARVKLGHPFQMESLPKRTFVAVKGEDEKCTGCVGNAAYGVCNRMPLCYSGKHEHSVIFKEVL